MAVLWVTGQISLTGSLGGGALGKKRSKVLSSLKVTKVREHLAAGAAAEGGSRRPSCSSLRAGERSRDQVSGPSPAGVSEVVCVCVSPFVGRTHNRSQGP